MALSHLRRHSRKVLVGSGLLLAGASGAGLYTNENWRRSAIFWSQAFPIYVHYRGTQIYIDNFTDMSAKEQSARYAKLHRRYKDDVLRIILQLRGFYVKMGQLGAQLPTVVPKEWLTNLRKLEDEVPPEPFSYVRSIVEGELGKPISEIFSRFDEVPLGSASIGQAHRATLKDGREVVVKVMYRRVEELFRGDIATLRGFCKLAQPEQLPFFAETEKQFLTEFNYAKEALNLVEIAKNLKAEWGARVKVPEPHLEFCTNSVLVMEYLPGDKLITAIRNKYRVIAEQQGMTLEQLERKYSSNEKGHQPIRSPSPIQMQLARATVATRDMAWNVLAFVVNWTFGWVFRGLGHPTHRIISYLNTELPLDVGAILKLIAEVHGHEMFVDGAFNGDPHAGNILMLPDGRLGLIDYGQVKHLTVPQRVKLARLIVSLSENNEPAILKNYIDMGYRSKNMNPDVIKKYAVVYFRDNKPETLDHKMIHEVMEELHKKDPTEKISDEYVMCGRVALMIHGIASALGLEMSIADLWRPYAERLLRDAGEEAC